MAVSSERKTYRPCADVRYRLIDDQAVVISQRAAEVLALNAVGARILALLDAERTPNEVTDLLGAEYDVERDELERDVRGFIDELVSAGIAEEVPRKGDR